MDRWTKALLVVVAIPLWGLWLGRPAQSQGAVPKSLTAQRFVVAGPDGRSPGEFGVTNNGIGLTMRRSDGKPAITALVGNDNPMIVIHDENRGRIGILLSPEKQPCIFLWNSAGNGGVDLQVTKEDTARVRVKDGAGKNDAMIVTQKALGPVFTLNDDVGNLRAMLNISKGEPQLAYLDTKEDLVMRLNGKPGEPSLYFNHPDQQPAVILGVTKQEPGLALYDVNGKGRLLLSGGSKGSGLVFMDKAEDIRAMVGIHEDGAGYIDLSDKDGRPHFTRP